MSDQSHVGVPGVAHWGSPTRSGDLERLHKRWPRIDFVLGNQMIYLKENSLECYTLNRVKDNILFLGFFFG